MHYSIAFSIHALACIGCSVCCYFIKKYLTSKPYGLQTLLDKFILDFVKAYLFLAIVANWTYFGMAELTLSHISALVIFVVGCFAWKLFMTILMATITIRYLSIFHPGVIEFKITDDQVIRRARIAYLIITM